MCLVGLATAAAGETTALALRCGSGTNQTTPAANAATTAELLPGSTHEYRLAIASAAQLRILLEADDPSISLTVCLPDGNVGQKIVAGYAGSVPVYVAAELGNYTILIERQNRPDAIGYRFSWRTDPYTSSQYAHVADAAGAYRMAEGLRHGMKRADVERALTLFQRAQLSWAAANDVDGQELALVGRGNAFLELSDYTQARTAYEAAVDLRKPGESLPAVLALAHLYVELQDVSRAMSYSEQALALARRDSDPRAEAAALVQHGQALFLQSKDDDAMRDFGAAFDIARRGLDRANIAAAEEGMGYVETDRGSLRRSTDHLAQAEHLWREIGDVRHETSEINTRAIVGIMAGDREQAIKLHSATARMFAEMGDRRRTAAALQNLGEAYMGLNQPRTSIDYLERSAAAYRSVHFLAGEFQALSQLCLAERRLGNTPKALRYCERAGAAVPLLHDPRRESVYTRYLADVYVGLGQDQKAEQLFTNALQLSRAAGDPRGEADALRSLAQSRARSGNRDAALELLAKALPRSEAAEDPEGVIAAHYEIARIQRAKGALADARREIEGALRLAETQRSRVGSETLRSTYFTSVRQAYELYAQILMDLHQRQPGAGLDRLALEQSEKAHARTLLDALVERATEAGSPPDPEGVARLRTLRAQIETASYQRMRLLAYGGSRKQLDASIERIRLLNAEYDALRSAPRANASAAAVDPSLSVEQIQQQALDPDTTLLEYMLGDEGGIAWAVTQQRVVSFALPPRDRLDKNVERWHTLMLARRPRAKDSPQSWAGRVRRADRELQSLSATLACTLLGPVISQIDSHRLVIVPDAGLEYVAFAALPLDGCTRQSSAPLVSRFEVVMVPSASSVAALRRDLHARPQPASGIAVLADPVFTPDDPRVSGSHPRKARPRASGPLSAAMRDLGWNTGIPRLPGTRLEATTIAQRMPSGKVLVALDFQASLATALRPDLARYRILHFATHGLLDSEHPEFSGLILSLVDRHGRDENGYLSAQDIYEQHLAADLVVLSACDSGLGVSLRGEGVVGLARAFLHAGAGRVVSSLWKIDDDATVELMRHFYDAMLRDHKSPAAALRYAQMQMMLQKRWAPPFYWAGFVLNGEWR